MKKSMHKILILFIHATFFLSCISSSLAQPASNPGNPFIQNYTTEEYSGGPQNWAVLQDNRGVMYFGNGQGVLEFDGNNWNLIRMPNNSTVLSLARDSSGTIYVGAYQEFGYLSADSMGKLTYRSLSANSPWIPKDTVFSEVWTILPTSHGVYFITESLIFRLENDSIDIIPRKSVQHRVILSGDEIILFYTASDFMVFNTQGTRDFRFHDILRVARIFPYNDHSFLALTTNGEFYIATTGTEEDDRAGSENNGHTSTCGLEKLQTSVGNWLIENNIYCSTVWQDYYIFGTLKGGIIIMDRQGGTVQTIGTQQGLYNNAVLKLCTDKNNNVWAALSDGISLIETGTPIRKYDGLSGLKDIILTFAEYGDKLYTGGLNGIYYLPRSGSVLQDGGGNFFL
ncbi:MAG: hypothetical protein ABII90_14855 [Bacteroidota bacterium]